MKNKKLFAILTLVCFMFTLMPMAAFAAPTVYAEVNEDSEIVKVDEAITMDITNGNGADYYVFALKGENLNKGLGITTGSAIGGEIVIAQGISTAGSYDVYVVDQNKFTDAIYKKYVAADMTGNEAAQRMIKESNVVMLSKAVTVKASKTEYTLTFDKANKGTLAPATDAAGKVIEDSYVLSGIRADSGYTEIDVYAKLTDADGKAVVGATVKLSTNSSAVDISADTVKTNAAGLAKFTLSSSVAGDFKVYAEYGTKSADLTVKATGLTAANITTIKQPKAPVALDSQLNKDVNVRFNITDANGNNTGVTQTTAETKANYRVVVVEKPAGSKIVANLIGLVQTKDGWAFDSDEVLDEEGTYTFKVILENGNYATASVEVKEFQKPVALTIEYPTAAVELNGSTTPEIKFVDANGVTKTATGVELSASGYAIKSFDSADGTLKV